MNNISLLDAIYTALLTQSIVELDSKKDLGQQWL